MTIDTDVGGSPTGGTRASKPAEVANRSADEASNLASAAAEGAREVTTEVATQAKAVAGEAKEQVGELVDRARNEARQQAELRSQQTASQLRTLSGNLSALADGRPGEAGPLVGYLQQAEQHAQSWASRLEQRGPAGVAEDLKQFARRRPAVYLGSALMAGFVVGRAVRAGVASQPNGDGQVQMPGPDGTSARPLSSDEIAMLPPDSSTFGLTELEVDGPETGLPLADPTESVIP